MTVRVAVLGAGIMGADHARIVAEDLPAASLQVVCDVSQARARCVAEACGASDIATDPEAVIARPDVDALLIATPDDSHATLTLAALALGKPVLCEKPLAPGSSACLAVIEREVALGRRLVHVGFMRRFDPGYAALRRAVHDDALGRPLLMHNVHRNVANPGAWFTPGMAIGNSASHEFDAARFVLGTDIASVAVFRPERSDELAAPVFLVLETHDRQLVNIEVNNNAAYGYEVRAELVGERGSMSLDALPPTRVHLARQRCSEYPADWRPRFAEAYRLQDKAWIAAIESGEPSATCASAWDGYAAAAVAEAGVRALLEGRRVTVDMPDRPGLYESLHALGEVARDGSAVHERGAGR